MATISIISAATPAATRVSNSVAPAVPGASRNPQRLRLTRRGRIVVVLAIALSAFVLGALGAMSAVASPASSPAPLQGWSQIVVQPGETLWHIASRTSAQGDPRAVMTEIRQVNELSGSQLSAGQRIWVPASTPTP